MARVLMDAGREVATINALGNLFALDLNRERILRIGVKFWGWAYHSRGGNTMLTVIRLLAGIEDVKDFRVSEILRDEKSQG